MSKISLKPASSGTATFTIEAPATNTNRVLELPNEAGKILTDVGVPTSAMPAGSVLQVVSTYPTENFTTTSSSMVDVTGYSLSITPTSATSRILISFGFRYGSTGSSDNGYQILRNSTALPLGALSSNNLGNVNPPTAPAPFMDTNLIIEDTPNTTSAVTYKLQVRRTSATLRINDRNGGGNNRYGYFILTEIAA